MGRYTRDSDWVQRNSEVKGKGWKKIQGHELTEDDIGKLVKFENCMEWESSSTTAEGILTRIGKPETYYFPVDIIPDDGSLYGMYYGSVYGIEVYVKKDKS